MVLGHSICGQKIRVEFRLKTHSKECAGSAARCDQARPQLHHGIDLAVDCLVQRALAQESD